MTMLKGIKPKGIIKNYNVFIKGNNFYDQPIDYDLRRCEKDYRTGYFLDYVYNKNYYRVIAADVSIQKNRC